MLGPKSFFRMKCEDLHLPNQSSGQLIFWLLNNKCNVAFCLATITGFDHIKGMLITLMNISTVVEALAFVLLRKYSN